MNLILTILFTLTLVTSGFKVLGQSSPTTFNGDSVLLVQTDSVNQKFSDERKKLDSIQAQVFHFYDSINEPPFIDSIKMSISQRRTYVDSLENAYNTHLKKLTELKLPPNEFNKRLDSLNKAQENVFTKVNDSVSKLEKKVTDRISKAQKKLFGKLKPAKDSLGIKGEFSPDLDLRDIKTSELTKVNNDGVGVKTGIEMPAGLTPELGSEKLKVDNPLENAQAELKELTSAPSSELKKLTEIEELNKIKTGVNEATQVGNEISDYTEDLDKISRGEDSDKLAKVGEDKLRKAGGLEELTRHEKRLEALKAEREKNLKLVKQYQDKDAIRKQLNDKTRNVANEKLLEKNDKVNDAAKNLGKYKKKYAEIQSIHDLPKRPPNPMKGKPIRERLLPGMVFQIQKTDLLSVFIAPQVNYQLNKRWVAGIGGVIRLRGTITDSLSYVGENFVYGFKSFANFKVYKGFALRAEWESLRVGLPPDDRIAQFKEWVNGYYVGIDKGFTINRQFRGDTQILYNLSYSKSKTPYGSPINFRFGFFLDMTKKRKLPGM